MIQTVIDTILPTADIKREFPHAPSDWSLDTAAKMAKEEGITLTEEHVKLLLDLQDYFFHHEGRVDVRKLHDALEEEFHNDGGIKHLYQLFPGGPITQGCRLAGLKPPPYSKEDNFGTVM